MTKSLSNVIKANTVYYDKNLTKTIDSHQNWKKKESLLKKSAQNTEHKKEPIDGFVKGLDAVQVKEIPSEEELLERSNKIIENAKSEASQILEQAKQEAATKQKKIYAEAKKKGYEDGVASGSLELKKKMDEVEDGKIQLQKEFETMVKELEPQIADIIASLVERITGLVVSDRKEVIIYLIEKALSKQDKCDDFKLRISNEDYDFVSKAKDTILASIGRDVTLKIIEDASLEKNQCLIETDLCVIDCGLDEQLKNLIMDIKLLGGAI